MPSTDLGLYWNGTAKIAPEFCSFLINSTDRYGIGKPSAESLITLEKSGFGTRLIAATLCKTTSSFVNKAPCPGQELSRRSGGTDPKSVSLVRVNSGTAKSPSVRDAWPRLYTSLGYGGPGLHLPLNAFSRFLPV